MINKKMNAVKAKTLRRLAEDKLKERSVNGMKSKEADIKKLIHELQVHQIELELQNEELLESYRVSEAALKKYTLLYDFAPMGYFTLNSEGTIIEMNFTAAEMLGDNRYKLINSNFRTYVADTSRRVFDEFLIKVFSSSVKDSCEVMLSYNNRVVGYVYMEGIVTGEERECLLSVVDISGFRK